MVQRGKKLLSLFLTAAMVASLVVVPAFAAPDTTDTTNEPQNGQDMSVGGEEGSSGGTTNANPEASEKPFQVGNQSYATLQEAFNAILQQENKTGTIIVTGNATVNAPLRCGNTAVDLIIKGQTTDGSVPVLTRGTIGQASDPARTTYNPAMIEVEGKLRLENIVLDDGSQTAGEKYIQATTTGDGQIPSAWDEQGNPTAYYDWKNDSTVQDAIIATYDGGDEIVLGDGVELRNFGGMSAVRLSGGKLTMEAGSKIVGSKEFTANGKGVTGPAGAVWMQGGELIMEAGAEIKDMSGRAVYVDSGKATIDGTICNITHNDNMWWAGEVGIHVRNGAQVTLGGTIDTMVDGKNAGKAVQLNNSNSKFTMVSGAVIKHTADRAIDASGGTVIIDNGAVITECQNGLNLRDSAHGELNGTITLGTGGHPVQLNSPSVDNPTELVIGETGKIINNYADYGAIYCQSGNIDLYGHIEGNYVKQHGGGIATPGHGPANITMYDGASISNNYAKENGGGVQVKDKTIFTMEGGTISGNVSTTNGGGVCVRNNAKFIMKGGTISGNSTKGYGGGISYEPATNFVELLGGTIADNKMQATVTADLPKLSMTVEGGKANDLAIVGGDAATLGSHYLQIAPAVTADRNVYMTTGPKTVTVTDGTKLGNASSTDVTALTTASTDKGWAAPMATLWAQNANSVNVTVAGVEFNQNLPIYVLVKNGDTIKSFKADLKDGIASFTAPGGETGIAIALVQPSADYGTLSLVADPVLLRDNSEMKITYTLMYTPSQNVLSSIDDIGENVTLDVSGLSVTKDELKNGFTKTWTVENVTFEAGKSVEQSARLTFTLGNASVEVPSNLAVTWMESRKDVTVTFDSNGGSNVPPLSVKEGDTVTQPTAPTRSGYTFNGWRAEGATENYDFTTPVTSDLTLVAQWTQNSGGGGTGGGGGGGGGGDIDIPDDPTPLGGDLQLNREDHFAYVSGYPDSSVQPGGHITREEVATIFYRLLTEQSKAIYGVTTNNFNDVEAERWSNEAISTLANAQVLQGYADGGFHPGDPITRAEFTAIVTRFDEVDSAPASPFSDTAGHWAEDVIAFAASKNWVGGYPDGSFRPQSDITRAEAMTMINNILDRLVDEEGILAEARQWPDNAKDAWYYYAVQEATNSHDYTRRSADGIVENWTALR